MQPYTREIVDRRAPGIRWSAVLAGTVVALGLWGVLQLLGLGLGLIALEPDDPVSARGISVGAGAWSVLAPSIAMFAGGYVAVKLASTDEPRVAGLHGLVVWGLTTAAGLLAMLWLVTTVARTTPGLDELRRSRAAHAVPAVEDRHLAVPLAPHELATDDGLGLRSSLARRDVPPADGLGLRSSLARRDVPPAEAHALQAAEDTGKGLLAFALAILLAGGTALLGSLRALRDRAPDGPRARSTPPGSTDIAAELDRPAVRASTAPYPLPARARRQVTDS